MTTDQPIKRNNKSLFMLAAAFALGAILAFAGFSFTSATSNGDVVAAVNGKAITKDYFYERLEEIAGDYVLDLLINEILIEQARETRGIVVTDEEVAQEVSRIRASYPSDEAFDEELANIGLTMERLNKQILIALILDQLQREGVDVSDEEVADFFEQYKSFFDRPESILVSHILVETKEEADKIIEELNDGADFAELAREKSLDTGSAAQGGSLGYVDSDAPLVTPFKEAAFALNPGETSAPINSQYGWHIIRVYDREEAKEATLEAHADQIREILIGENLRDVEEIYEDLRRDATIDIQWSRYEFLQ